jgi:hypothetical protein
MLFLLFVCDAIATAEFLAYSLSIIEVLTSIKQSLQLIKKKKKKKKKASD